MKIYLPPDFAKRAAKEGVTDDACREAVDHAERGLIDGRLAGHLIKQRVARQGQGRAGGFRTIICYVRGDLAVFLHMFAKNSQANLTKREQSSYRDYADTLAAHSEEDFSRLVTRRGWRRIEYAQPEKEVPK